MITAVLVGLFVLCLGLLIGQYGVTRELRSQVKYLQDVIDDMGAHERTLIEAASSAGAVVNFSEPIKKHPIDAYFDTMPHLEIRPNTDA